MAIILKLLGSLVNCLTVLVGSTIGLGIKKGIPEKYENAVMNAIALSLNMLKLTNLKVMNMLPAIFLPIAIYMLPIF